jgi:hypothetical protein
LTIALAPVLRRLLSTAPGHPLDDRTSCQDDS